MDTNTGEIRTFTPEEVAAQIAKVDLRIPGLSEDELMRKLFPNHTPLKKLPDKNCRKCFGVGHRGKNLSTGKYVPCSCTQ